MIEIRNGGKKTCSLEEMCCGDVFLFENKLYILTDDGDPIQIGGEESGDIGEVHRDDAVLPVDIEIIIK